MSLTIDLRTTLKITDSEADADAIPETVVVEKRIVGATEMSRKQFTVQNTARTIYDASGSDPADWQLLVIWSDVAVDLELTAGEGEATEELSSVRLAPNVPFVLGADDSYRDHDASDAFAGTLDVIDKIRVDEPNNVEATVRVLLVK